MIVKESRIRLVGFWVLQTSISFDRKSYLGHMKKRLNKKTQREKIDLRYTIFKTGKLNRFRIDCEVKSINKVGSYLSFDIKTESHFEIFRTSKKQDIDNMLLGQAIPMIISNTRSYLLMMSGMYPVNRYLLPSIDLEDLYTRNKALTK
jgi:hypothetical protein